MKRDLPDAILRYLPLAGDYAVPYFTGSEYRKICLSGKNLQPFNVIVVVVSYQDPHNGMYRNINILEESYHRPG